MQNFVNKRATQGTQQSQGANSKLQRNHADPANLKVGVPSIGRSNISQALNATSMQHSGKKSMTRDPNPQGKATIVGPRDTFAPTEYEGSTMSTISRVQVQDSQVDSQGHSFAYHSNGSPALQGDSIEDGSEESGEEYEDGEESDERAEEQDPNQHLYRTMQQAQAMMHKQQQQFNRSLFDGDDSYPPTTSGRPDDDEEGDELSHADEQDLPELPQGQPTQPPQHSSLLFGAGIQRPGSSHLEQPSRQLPRSLQHPSSTQQNLTLRLSPPIAKPPRQQIKNLHPAEILAHARPASAPQPPQSKTAAKSRPLPTVSAKVNGGRGPAVVTPVLVEPEETEEVDKLKLDYDAKVLEEMSYEDLRKQDFDYDPTNPPSVLPDDSPPGLPVRLSLVQKLKSNEQRTYFSSLPLTEWEEAGDWFLTQFSDVVKKLTDARKEKRQLVVKLEEEIAKRHDRVAGRKRDIDEALAEMGKSGRDVLKGSTPKRQKGPDGTY